MSLLCIAIFGDVIMSAKNVLLGGSIILVIILMGGLIVTATFIWYRSSNNDSITGQVTAQRISEEQARTIALNAVKGTIKKIELEQEKGRYIYEVEVDKDGTEFEVSIDSVAGKVIDIEKEIKEENSEVEALTQSSGSTISEDEAIRIAEDRLGSSFDLEEIDTGSYRGIKAWELEFESGSEEAEVIIDMETGEILNIEYEEEDDDDED